MDFKQELKKYVELIETNLKKYIKPKDVPEHILNESMEYSLLAGGKRIRPALMISTYRFVALILVSRPILKPTN